MRARPVEDLWLDQFNEQPDDYKLAKTLFEKIRYVSDSDLRFYIRNSLDQIRAGYSPCALFVERELQKTKSNIPPGMYKEQKRKVPGRKKHALSAKGAAIQAVQSLKYTRQEIGSEGIIAQILSKYCEMHPNELMLQPTAEEIRAQKVRSLVIVTDFIGSGKRALDMLSSLWRVRSVRSWVSYKLIDIYIVCVSGTQRGISAVERHPSKPKVINSFACPTIGNSFDPTDAFTMVDLCKRYGSFDKEPLGYGSTGALIAFEHSAPNNMPAIFVKSSTLKRRPWSPIFLKRSTDSLWDIHENMERNVKDAFSALGLGSIALHWKYKHAPLVVQHAILISAISSRGYSRISDQIQYSGIPLRCFDLALARAENERWIGPSGKVTERGRRVVENLASDSPLEIPTTTYYYPKQLRAPL